MPSISIRDFSNYFLLIPSYPSDHPMVLQNPLNWLIIPREYFTIDGRECNKIGVSYSAFRSQANQCLARIGECLNNQIYDLMQNDFNRISNGNPANFIISQAKLMNDAEVNFYSYSGESKKFSFKLNGVFNSLISLEISADELKYIVNISEAKIDYLKTRNFENNSKSGLLQMQVTNVGKLTAEFNVAFSCTDFVLPLAGESFSLGSYESKSIQKNIYTANSDEDFRQNNFTLKHNCSTTISDIIGNLLDHKSVLFNTSKIVEINTQLPQNSTISQSSENKTDDSSQLENKEFIQLDCEILCPNFFNFLCFVLNGCWGYLIRTLIILLVLLVLSILIIKSIKNGTFCGYIRKIFFCFSSVNNKKYNLKSKADNDNNSKINLENYNIPNNNYVNNNRFENNYPQLNNKNYKVIYKQRDELDSENSSDRICLFDKTMFLNFSNVNFDFSHANIFKNFSVEVNIIYFVKQLKNGCEKININQIIFPDNFIKFCHKVGISEITNFRILKNKINYIPNFLTNNPLFSLFH